MSDLTDPDALALEKQLDDSRHKQRPSIFAIAGPAALANLLMSIVGLINIKMVGTLGTEAIAAVSTGTRIFFIFQTFFMAVNAGTTALVARHWGAGNYDKAASVLHLSILINSFFALASSIFL